jgi:glycosyltransferase involved in cell wall biosynthesis
MYMLISFIIPAHNEEQLIGQCLASLHEAALASGRAFEIIVAADACTDRTVEIARVAGAAVIEHERRQIAATRNLGARHAKGDVLFFIDADTFVNAQSLREAIAALDAGAAGGGSPFILDGVVPWHVRLFLPVLMLSFRLKSLTGGAFFFCTNSAFVASGRWDEQYFASEEIHLAREIKKLGRFVIVSTPVLTSGRKVRMYSGWRVWMLIFSIALRPSMLKDRSRMWLWYDPREPDRSASQRSG